MCTPFLIPKKKKKKKYFQRIASPVSRGWNESSLIGWSRRHRANCKRFLQAGRGRKNKASAIEWPVIFKWTVATHPRVWNSVWLSRNIYLSAHCFHPSSLCHENQSLASCSTKVPIVFPSPLLFHFCFSFLFFVFSFVLSPFLSTFQYLPRRFARSSHEELKQQRLPFNARLQPLRLWIHPGSILTPLFRNLSTLIHEDTRKWIRADEGGWRVRD